MPLLLSPRRLLLRLRSTVGPTLGATNQVSGACAQSKSRSLVAVVLARRAYSSTIAARATTVSPIHSHLADNSNDNNSSNSSNNSSKSKTLVVIAGWMGANEKQLKSYVNWYNNKGIDVLSFSVGPMHILKPSSAMDQMRTILEEVQKRNCQVCFHHFSVGGYLFGQMLRLIAAESEKYDAVVKKIRGQIFDSPPDINGISTGISRGIGIPAPLQFIVKGTIDAYLSATKGTTGVEHTAASDAFHNNHIAAPSLWFYSNADQVARWQDCKIVSDKWSAKGIDVTSVVWENTPHIQHARKDPDRYFGALEQFLKKNKIL